jgi:hypothetical protein
MLVAGYVLVVIVALFMSLIFVAFADSPDWNLAARRALIPAMVWIVISLFLARRWIMHPAGWWSYPLAYLIAASPPVFLFFTVSLLMKFNKRK